MSGQELEPRQEVVLPTGELVDISDPLSCALALPKVRDLISQLYELKGAIDAALAEEALRQGENTFALSDGTRVQVRKNYDTTWDVEQLEDDLRKAGMPEERISQVVVEVVTHTVAAKEANKAAKANPAYAEAIENARSKVEKRPTISVSKG